MRLDKFLAHAGYGTRREVKKIIANGITINNRIIKSSDFQVKDVDEVFLDGSRVIYREFYYILLNKPKGYISATEDNIHPTVLDLLEKYKPFKIAPVGRLDIDTTGVMLLTNNGKLNHALLAPNRHVEKEYFVTVDKKISLSLVQKFAAGLILEDGYQCHPAELKIIDDFHARLIIHEGKFHQVKRMFKIFGCEVIDLARIRFDFLEAESLAIGDHRELNDAEIAQLMKRIK